MAPIVKRKLRKSISKKVLLAKLENQKIIIAMQKDLLKSFFKNLSKEEVQRALSK